MKKIYNSFKIAMLGTVIFLAQQKMVVAQTVVYGPHVQDAFVGNPANLYTWDVNTSGALISQDNTSGLVTVTTALQSGTTTVNSVVYNKFRADIKKTGVTSTNLLQLDPTTYPIVAIKMSLPSSVQTNITFDTGFGSYGNGSNKYTGVINTSDGRNVYYYDLNAAGKYFGAGTTTPTNQVNNLNLFQFKVADALSLETSNATAPTYQVDWIQTFASLSDLNIAIASVLPVSLTGYNVKLQSTGDALVSWSVSSENNNNYFLLERKGENGDFKEISKQSSKGNGQASYSFIDVNAATGVNYYRLSQVDLNGKVTELGVKSLNIDLKSAAALSIFPNPVTNNHFSFNYSKSNKDVSVKIIDLAGKIVFNQMVKASSEGLYEVSLLSNVKPGMYVLEVDHSAQQKLIIR